MYEKFMRIVYIPRYIYHRFYRGVADYLGSMAVKKFLHTSTCIRRFEDADLKKVLEIFEICFRNKNYNQIVRYSKLFRNTLYIYEINGTIIGYIGYYVHQRYKGMKKKYIATIYLIAMDPSFQGKGYGNQILKESICEMQNNSIDSIFLYVDIENIKAISLYQKNGFTKIGSVNDICGNGKKCYKMQLDLK